MVIYINIDIFCYSYLSFFFLIDIASRDKLAKINEKIVKVERQVTYLEAMNSSLDSVSVVENEVEEDTILQE